jgi:transcriptional regulator with XRE-family HTH domain
VEPDRIGKRIRFFRQQREVTQMELAERAGVSYQQIQKYENDKSQITLRRLALIAKALDTPMQAFLSEERGARLSEKAGKYPREGAGAGRLNRDERMLLSLFREIDDVRLKTHLLSLVRSIVERQRRKG